jgi:hypothetical protein
VAKKDSPYPFLAKSVDGLHAERLTFVEFLRNLDTSDLYLKHWAESLQQLKVPQGLPNAALLLQSLQGGVEKLWEASGALREVATHDDPARLEAALRLAKAGHEQVLEALNASEQTLSGLE